MAPQARLVLVPRTYNMLGYMAKQNEGRRWIKVAN